MCMLRRSPLSATTQVRCQEISYMLGVIFSLEVEGCGLLVNIQNRDNLPIKDKMPAPNVSIVQRLHSQCVFGGSTVI